MARIKGSIYPITACVQLFVCPSTVRRSQARKTVDDEQSEQLLQFFQDLHMQAGAPMRDMPRNCSSVRHQKLSLKEKKRMDLRKGELLSLSLVNLEQAHGHTLAPRRSARSARAGRNGRTCCGCVIVDERGRNYSPARFRSAPGCRDAGQHGDRGAACAAVAGQGERAVAALSRPHLQAGPYPARGPIAVGQSACVRGSPSLRLYERGELNRSRAARP